jgi:hypothetical protein
MSLGGILAKLLSKAKTQSHPSSTGWGDWMDTPEGKAWEALSEVVYAELETAKINVRKRRIILKNEARLAKLTINQAARYIADKTGHDSYAIREHVMFWLEEVGESDDPERDDDLELPDEIQTWIEEARLTNLPSRKRV